MRQHPARRLDEIQRAWHVAKFAQAGDLLHLCPRFELVRMNQRRLLKAVPHGFVSLIQPSTLYPQGIELDRLSELRRDFTSCLPKIIIGID